MTFHTRTLLMVTFLVVVAVLATAAVLGWSARESLLAQTQGDAVLIANLLSRSAEFATQVPKDVEHAIGEQMVVEATIAAHLVAMAEAAGMSAEKINAHLRAITDTTVLDEFWITDERGHAYLRNTTGTDFTFSPSPVEQPQAHIFWALLTGRQRAVVQEARQREVDTQVFKYAAVAGVDKPRIVQVGYRAEFLDQLRRRTGLARMVDELVAGGNVLAIDVVDGNIARLAHSAAPGRAGAPHLSESDVSRLRMVVSEGRTVSFFDAPTLKVMAPVVDQLTGQVVGATFAQLPTEHLRGTMRRQIQLAAVVAAVVLAVGLLASVILARRVTEPVTHLTAAAGAVEAGAFDADSLAAVARRRDELGQLARVFQRMAREVKAREQHLMHQLHELRIEIDESKKARQVSEITETDYFHQLQEKARRLRAKSGE